MFCFHIALFEENQQIYSFDEKNLVELISLYYRDSVVGENRDKVSLELHSWKSNTIKRAIGFPMELRWYREQFVLRVI